MIRIPTLRLAAALAALIAPLAAHAQGILTISPGRSIATTAGTGAIGFGGNNGPATSATLASPSALAYDASGNLYIADTNNHAIRELVKSSGNLVTVAGTGTAGFSGDGGSATSALLDTPTGIAIDASGNLYIADSHNHVIRKVASGTISTVAGTGKQSGFFGDGAAATSALLATPTAVAVATNGNLYIADTNNQRIRMVASGTISTIAGTGDQGFSGDGGAATSALLDSPSGLAVDPSGNIYIADRHNQRVRMVAPTGAISTIAGSGLPTFAGAYTGDGAAASSAALSRPTGVSVDASGNLYIADTSNQRIRLVSSGAITTVEGNGGQGFSGDGAAATAATFNAPTAAALDTAGNLTVADTLDQRIRTSGAPTLALATTSIGATSATQAITLADTGSSPLTLSAVTLTGPFAASAGGTCPAAPITLAAGASCTLNIAFLPTAASAATGSATFSGTGIPAQTVLLTGTGIQAGSSTSLASNAAAPFINQSITFTASVKPVTGGSPTGAVTFYSNGVSIGAGTLSGGSATLTTTFAAAGSYAITATYTGDANFSASSTPSLTQLVGDFNFTIVSGSTGSSTQTITSGQAVTYTFTVGPLSGPFTFPITLSASGIPPGATVTFTPPTITLGASPVTFTMTIQTAKTTGSLRNFERFGGPALALMLLPFATRMRRSRRKLRTPLLLASLLFSLASIAGLSGCLNQSPPPILGPQTYLIDVAGTASGSNGATLQHVTVVSLTVQ